MINYTDLLTLLLMNFMGSCLVVGLIYYLRRLFDYSSNKMDSEFYELESKVSELNRELLTVLDKQKELLSILHETVENNKRNE